MSQAALCQAVRDQLQTTFSLDTKTCQVCLDGQPQNRVAGEFYVAVHPASWNGISMDWDLTEEIQICVTLTMRASFAPGDRAGVALWLSSADSTGPDGMEARLRKALAAIHQNQLVRIAANTYIQQSPARFGGGLFVTPLYFLRVDPPQIKDWTWLNAAPPKTEHSNPMCAVAQRITFGKAQRAQDVPDMD